MADIFTTLVTHQIARSTTAKVHDSVNPGLSPVMKDGIWNERAVSPGSNKKVRLVVNDEPSP